MEMELDSTTKVPEEILYFILSLLPARNLLLARATSRDWAETIDCLLRTRLCSFDSDATTEIVFESTAPFELRSAGRLVVTLSEFVNGSNKLSKDLAIFNVPRNSHFLELDDEQAFGSMLLSLHLQGVDKTRITSPIIVEDEEVNIPDGARPIPIPRTMSAVGIPPIISPFDSPPPRPNAAFTFSLTLAEGLERLYRTWFEISPSGGTSNIENQFASLQVNSNDCMETEDEGRPSRSSSRSRTESQILKPSGTCAVAQAHIQCFRNKPRIVEVSTHFNSSYGSHTYIPSEPQLFEFFYTQLYLEVGKLVVSIEEGKQNFENKSRFVFMMRNGN